MRQGEDKHHCIGEGERLRERGGGGNQLSTSPPPGREAQQRDRPGRRRHSLTHTQSQRRTDKHPGQCVEVRRELVWDSECGGRRWAGCSPTGRQVHESAGPGRKKTKKKRQKESVRERGVSSPGPVSPDSSATSPSPWENGPFWRGCWRRLSSSTLL